MSNNHLLDPALKPTKISVSLLLELIVHRDSANKKLRGLYHVSLFSASGSPWEPLDFGTRDKRLLISKMHRISNTECFLGPFPAHDSLLQKKKALGPFTLPVATKKEFLCDPLKPVDLLGCGPAPAG